MQNFQSPIKEMLNYGENLIDPPETLPKGFYAKAENVLLTDNKIAKVPGCTAVAASIASQKALGIGTLENFATASKYIIVALNGASNAQLYRWSGTGSFTSLAGATMTNDLPVWFETAANSMFAMNGVEVIDYDGTTVTKNRVGIPKTEYASWFHNFMFLGKNPVYVNRLYWSDLGAPLAYTAANYVDINPGDSDEITGLGRLGSDELFVFKRRTIWSITGWSGSTFNASTIATQNTNARLIGYGCVAPYSIVSVGNDIYFLSMMGTTPVIRSLRKTQLSSTLGGGIISREITPTMERMTRNSIEKCYGIFDGRYVWWAIPIDGATEPNYIIKLDTWVTAVVGGKRVYGWTHETGKNAAQFALSTIDNAERLYFTQAGSTGLVMKIDTSVYGNNGVAIPIEVVSRSYMPEPARRNNYLYHYMRHDVGVNTTLTVSARVDDSGEYTVHEAFSLLSPSPGLGPTGTFTLGVSTLGGQTKITRNVHMGGMIGKTLSMKYTESSTLPVTIYDREIYYKRGGLTWK